MKNINDQVSESLSPGARRQEAYRHRQQAEGKRQMMLWIHDASWKVGRKAGKDGVSSSPVPEGVDTMSWLVGWVDGTKV